jgi:hypothetical protein
MFDRIRSSIALASSLAIAVIAVPRYGEASQTQGRTTQVEHAIAGELRKVDYAAKTLVVRATNGVDEAFKFAGQVPVHGADGVTRLGDAARQDSFEGASVVVHYTGEGVNKTVVAIDHIGKHTLRVAKGTLVRLDDAGTFVVIKTAEGVEETFQLTRDVVIDTLRGLEEAARATSHAIKKGAEVTVHYTDEGGRRVAYLMNHA